MLASPRSTRPRRSPQLLPATGRTGLVACLPPAPARPGPGAPVISMPGSGSCPGQRPAQPGLLCSESRGRDLVKVHRLGPRPGCAIFSPAAPCPARPWLVLILARRKVTFSSSRTLAIAGHTRHLAASDI